MATIVAYAPINLLSASSWYGQVIVATSTEITLTDGHSTSTYIGQGFGYSGDYVVSGVLTGYNEYYNGVLLGSASGFAMSAPAAANLIQSNNLASLLAIALSGNDLISGSAYNDDLAGYSGNDIIYGGTGNNYIVGGAGLDIAIFDGIGGAFTMGSDGVNIFMNKDDGSSINTLNGVERAQFDDGILAFDFGGNAGQAYRIYQAAFDRTPDLTGLSYWIRTMDGGASLLGVSHGFVNSAEFAAVYGANSSIHDFVAKLYGNVLGRPGEDGGTAYWEAQLASGHSRAEVMASFSESPENVAGVAPSFDHGIWYL